MGSEWRSWGFCMLVGILLFLFYNGRCEGRFEEEIPAADACVNGTIGHCLMEKEVFMDDTDEIKEMYESVELVMDSEISRRILQTNIKYDPLKEAAAKQGAAHGQAYTRPCTYKNQCDRP
ncbi:hypothetical protein ACLOJK_002054 [Asimina triloba]